MSEFKLVLHGALFMGLSCCGFMPWSAIHAEAEVRIVRAPFKIPPSGIPGQLTGGLRYQGPSGLAFDSRNRPYFLHSYKNAKGDPRPDFTGAISTLRDGQWVRLSFKDAIQKVAGDFQFKTWPHGIGSIVMDHEDSLYLITHTDRGCFLVYSSDSGDSFQAYKLESKNWCGGFLETRTGHNMLAGAPAIGLLSDSEELVCEWSTRATLSVMVPRKHKGKLVLKATEVTRNSFGISNHSGGYSFAATLGNHTHFVYAEYDEKIKGNPTWIATLDRKSGKITARKHLLNASPKQCDVHATPVIAVDSKGYLHVLAGSNNQSFQYLRSLKPNSIEGGWSAPIPVGDKQTGATLLCDKNDTLYSLFRSGGLHIQSKKAHAAKWSKPVEVVQALGETGDGFRNYYHQFFTDRSGALYGSFSYTQLKVNEIYPRGLMVSKDTGKNWQLVRTAGFEQRLIVGSGIAQRPTARDQSSR